jgi:carboxylesterase type B
MELGEDIIVATINYRVGPLGFLAGQELVGFNEAHNEPACNYGLHDQARAFEWLSKFIPDFGGDGYNITIQGTSAGAASCHYHCAFPDRKFKRAILASGTAIGIGPLDHETHQKEFIRVARGALGPETTDSPFTLKRLCSVPVKHLTDKVPFLLCHPYIDGVFIRGKTIYDMFTAVHDPPDIMVGAAAREDDVALVLMSDLEPVTLAMRPASDQQILDRLEELFLSNVMLANTCRFPFNYRNILDLYSLNESIQHPSTGQGFWVRFLADIVFNFPTIYTVVAYNDMFASETQSKAWLFQFDAKDPYTGFFAQETAHHGVNDIFLFDVAPDAVPAEKLDSWSRTSKNLQRVFIEFANGKAPYPPVVPRNRAGTGGSVGPVGPLYIFDDGDGSRIVDNIQEILGDLGVRRCDAVLAAGRTQ